MIDFFRLSYILYYVIRSTKCTRDGQTPVLWKIGAIFLSKTDEVGGEGLGRRGLWEEGILQSHRWQAHVRLPTINNYCLSPWRRHGDNKRMNYHGIVWVHSAMQWLIGKRMEKGWKENGMAHCMAPILLMIIKLFLVGLFQSNKSCVCHISYCLRIFIDLGCRKGLYGRYFLYGNSLCSKCCGNFSTDSKIQAAILMITM